MPDAPLIKIELGKAANTFIEKVASGFGVLYEPKRIKKKAAADAVAMITAATAKSEVSTIEQRATQRLLAEAQRNQHNMESILNQTVPQIEETGKPEQVNDDWLANFFEKSKLTSDEEMQLVWSRLLAGEVNIPGTFSKRTINLVSELEKEDAQLFSKLANFAWTIDQSQPLVFDVENQIYQQEGINFRTLKHLESLGFIHFETVNGFRKYRRDQTGGVFLIEYADSRYEVRVPEDNTTEIDIGHVMLTAQGLDLIKVCSLEPVDGFVEYVIEQYEQSQMKVIKVV